MGLVVGSRLFWGHGGGARDGLNKTKRGMQNILSCKKKKIDVEMGGGSQFGISLVFAAY